MPHQTASFAIIPSPSKVRLFSRFVLPLTLSMLASVVQAADINTKLPKETEGNFIAPITVDIPAQPLDVSLQQFARTSGVSLSFDSNLARNKKAPAVKGHMTRKEALQRLLAGSGLEANIDGDSAILKPATDKDSLLIKLDAVNVRAQRFYEVGPLPGLGLTKEQIPGNVQSISAKQIKESNALSIADLLNTQLQSVNVNDYQGNPFQMDVTYRGFTASPQIGTPQGLSVFMDGIRVNEPFGDVVNWDMIPMNALASFDVFPGSNPIFGLGTLGGAFSMKTKDGFANPGVDAQVLTGSFGRKQLQATGGWNNGTIGLFAAGNFFLEDGWRENSPSKVNQLFTKASYRGEKLDLNLSSLIVQTDLVGNGLIPSEMYKQNREGVFTSPDTTKNDLIQFQLSGSYFVNENFTITAQAYRRDSKRKSVGADVYTEHQNGYVRRALAPGEQYTCLFNSTNSYGLPDYYVYDVPQDDFAQSAFINEYFANGGDDAAALATIGATLNPSLTDTPEAAAYLAYAQGSYNFNKNIRFSIQNSAQGGNFGFNAPPGEVTPYSNGNSSYAADVYVPGNITTILGAPVPGGPGVTLGLLAYNNNYYFTPDGTRHVVVLVNPNNADLCKSLQQNIITSGQPLLVEDPANPGKGLRVDGATAVGGQQPGVVEGTPTAVLTNTQIDQITDGGSVQLNWNYPKHKFMVGASIDAPSAKYESGQRLGLMDAQRNVFLAPDQIRDQYTAADFEISNNNFKGSQVTKSLYASETWSPIETLNFTGSARYNETHGKNKIASRTFGTFSFDLSELESLPDDYNICPNGVCPTAGYHPNQITGALNKPEKEKFSYFSLNPSLGVSWQAKENLNLYANWSQGVRTPSVIELGCAFDETPVKVGVNPDTYLPKSLAENRSCSLPTTLSGDPYLPQIKANTFDLGMRGKWGDNTEWNLGAYNTDLRDDIYLVSFPGNRSYFASIGDTRRRGVEAGVITTIGKAKLKINYALTDATFQEGFPLAANDNSSSVENVAGNDDYGRLIQVKRGDHMPGVPKHNLNATLSYDLTSKWNMAFTAVAHSSSYVRGNENNEHKKGVVLVDTIETDGGVIKVPRKPTSNPGSIDGYMTLNFRTSYQLAPEWRLGLQVSNIFDKEYFSAGRLGRNPFSPSVYGAIGPDGYNHNSSDWLSSNFLAPGAPRAAWVSLTYEFDPRK